MTQSPDRDSRYIVGVDVGTQLPDAMDARHANTSRGSVMQPRSAEAATV